MHVTVFTHIQKNRIDFNSMNIAFLIKNVLLVFSGKSECTLNSVQAKRCGRLYMETVPLCVEDGEGVCEGEC